MEQWNAWKLYGVVLKRTIPLTFAAAKTFQGSTSLVLFFVACAIYAIRDERYKEMKWWEFIQPSWAFAILAILVIHGWFTKIAELLNEASKRTHEAEQRNEAITKNAEGAKQELEAIRTKANERLATVADLKDYMHKLLMEAVPYETNDKPYDGWIERLIHFTSEALVSEYSTQLQRYVIKNYNHPKHKLGECKFLLNNWYKSINAEWIKSTLTAKKLQEL